MEQLDLWLTHGYRNGTSGDDVFNLRGVSAYRGGAKISLSTGNDTLTGGTGADVFAVSVGWGQDMITDFSAYNGEKIDLSAINAISDFSTLVSAHLRSRAGQAQIFDGTNTILLQGVTVAQFCM